MKTINQVIKEAPCEVKRIIKYKGTWNVNTEYRVNELLKVYGWWAEFDSNGDITDLYQY